MNNDSPRSLFFQSNGAVQPTIDELHVNYWITDPSDITVEIGLMMTVAVAAFHQNHLLTLIGQLQMPAADSTLELLDDTCVQVSVARWLFNDNVTIATLPSVGGGNEQATAIRKSNGETFLVLGGQRAALDASEGRRRCEIHLDLNTINPASLSQYASGDGQSVRVYTRFKYRVDRECKSGYGIERGIWRNHLYLDMRFNDVRAMPAATVSKTAFLQITRVRVFLIHPLDYKLTLQPEKSKRYERLLERGQDSIAKYFPVWSHRTGRIHQWVLSQTDSSDAGSNMMIMVDCPKSPREKIAGSVYLLLLALILCGVTLWLDTHATLADGVKSILDGLISLIVALVLGITIDAVRGTKKPWA